MRKANDFLGGFAAVLLLAALAGMPAAANNRSASGLQQQPPKDCCQVPIVAFSAVSCCHTSSGPIVTLSYDNTLSNVGEAWDDDDTFTAPVAGPYFFAIEFVKDSFYNGGTEDDVTIYLQLKPKGKDASRPVGAWSGEGAGRRGTGAVSTVLVLNKGDKVRTQVGSEPANNPTRHIIQYNFSGFLIK